MNPSRSARASAKGTQGRREAAPSPAEEGAAPVQHYSSPMLNQAGEGLAFLGALALALVGWIIGASFTLAALVALGAPLSQVGGWQWLIPVAVSAIEVRWWPGRTDSEGKGILFTIVAGLDMLSTYYGFILWASGRFIPLGIGFTLPTTGSALLGMATVVSVILTFAPERVLVWALHELRKNWST